MIEFAVLKSVHVICAFLSFAGFALRGYWKLTDNSLLQRRAARIVPHIIDTLLLLSAVGMLYLWRLSPFAVSWLSAKIIALLVYIVLGMVALRYGRSRPQRLWAWCAAMATIIYIATVAFTKSPTGIAILL